MKLDEVLNKIEEYQALTGQEGNHIDELRLFVKFYFIKSKYLENTERRTIELNLYRLLNIELQFSYHSENDDAYEVIFNLINSMIPVPDNMNVSYVT
ncbi:hypothetical protein [Aliivibrio fischeri]|uniref:hypothetical protein n=1 Tax=Aliivibrio fischeri TaxID=668 RepID=UPI00138DFB9D|nr:hypothetical protein [Aliivibrio fischeri]